MCTTGNFKVQLGDRNQPGFLSQQQRLASIRVGENPFVTGTALLGNSPVFVGRTQLIHTILSHLKKPDKPGCVSLIGERRIGKSSLLNQIFQALASEPDLISIKASAQNWDQHSQQLFYASLQHSIIQALNLSDVAKVSDYPGLRDFIGGLAKLYRFVLIIDEFEVMASNPNFDANFFSNLRALADLSDYRFGYLICSLNPLKDLCRHHKIEASSFWNIFVRCIILDY